MAPVSTSPAAFAPTQPMEAVKPDPARLSQPTPVDESTVEHAELAAFAHHHTPAAVPMEAARVFRSARSQPTPPPVVAEPAPSGDITTPPGAEESVEETMSRVKRLRDRGDVASALQGVELVLAVDASHPEAYALREQLRHQLTVLRMAQLEPLDRVPNVTPAAMSGVSRRLNTRSAFLLSRVDGFSSIRDIIDMSGLPALEAIETMQQLIDEGFVRF